MIAHSIIVLIVWISSILIPLILVSEDKNEEKYNSCEKTHFMRG